MHSGQPGGFPPAVSCFIPDHPVGSQTTGADIMTPGNAVYDGPYLFKIRLLHTVRSPADMGSR